MVWDPSRQDQTILEFYKKMISLRHRYPIITCWDDREMKTDETGKVLIENLLYGKEKMAIIFNCSCEQIQLESFAGQYDLVAEKQFDGILSSYQAAVLLF